MSTLIHSLKSACQGEDTQADLITAACAIAALVVNGLYFFS